jgi:hypothetical protein
VSGIAMMSEPLSDPESGSSSSPPSTHGNPQEYFWKKPKVYSDEWRIWMTPIPLWRFLTSMILLYTFIYSCTFIATLCTDGSKFICTTSLLAASAYLLWAIWWDVPYSTPPTWTQIKLQQFNPVWVIIWLTYQTVLVGMAFFICITVMIINYANLRELFQWECWR